MPELRTIGGLRFLIWRLVVNVLDEVNLTNMTEPACLSGLMPQGIRSALGKNVVKKLSLPYLPSRPNQRQWKLKTLG